MELLRTMEERALVEYGCEGDEADKLLCSYAELLDEWPTLFVAEDSNPGPAEHHPFRVRVRVRLRLRQAADGGAEVEAGLSVHAMLTGGVIVGG